MPGLQENNAITADEIALYDRQIRLWGLDAQQKMRLSSILLIGCKGVSLETAKNLVLAGIKELVLVDDKAINQDDVEIQFYLDQQDIGKKRSDVLAQKLKALNPRVEIRSLERQNVNDEILVNSDIVVCVGQTLNEQIKFNTSCRNSNTKFISSNAFGLFGYIFCDLLNHTYIEEKKELSNENNGETKTTKVTKSQEYVSLESTLKARFEGLSERKLKRKTSPLLFAHQALWVFEQQNERLPDLSQKGDFKILEEISNSIAKERGIPKSFVNDELLERIGSNASTEYPPANAVMGGMLAQEVLKAITGKELPATNFFLFDAITNEGSVCHIVPS